MKEAAAWLPRMWVCQNEQQHTISGKNAQAARYVSRGFEVGAQAAV